MLVLSREIGTSIFVDSAGVTSVVTLLKLHADRHVVSLSVDRLTSDPSSHPATSEVSRDTPFDLGNGVTLSLIDLHASKARIGITAPRAARIHRLEVYEAIDQENRAARGHRLGPEDGLAGSPVPNPSKPKPPSLDVRLKEPPSADH